MTHKHLIWTPRDRGLALSLALRLTLGLGLGLGLGVLAACTKTKAKPSPDAEPIVQSPHALAEDSAPPKPPTASHPRFAEGHADFFTAFANLQVRGEPLRPALGLGVPFGPAQRQWYQAASAAARGDRQCALQWQLINLGSGQIIAGSANPDRLFYGASVAKVFVAGAYLEHVGGRPSAAAMQQLADMIVVSDNIAWKAIQVELGGGQKLKGQAAVQSFINHLGLKNSIGFEGWMDAVHGNEVSAADLLRFLQATYQGKYPGAEHLWRLMAAARTGDGKGLKYLPSGVPTAGKTGTYHGRTAAPRGWQSPARPYVARVHHHLLAFPHGSQAYGLAILSDLGSDEAVAIMAGGIYREFIAAATASAWPG